MYINEFTSRLFDSCLTEIRSYGHPNKRPHELLDYLVKERGQDTALSRCLNRGRVLYRHMVTRQAKKPFIVNFFVLGRF
jgi:hypothetical protein